MIWAMRLRFRGENWSGGEAVASNVAPHAPLGAVHSKQRSRPTRSLNALLHSEGVRVGAPSPVQRPRTIAAEHLASWSCASAVQCSWNVGDRHTLRPEEFEDDADPTPVSMPQVQPFS